MLKRRKFRISSSFFNGCLKQLGCAVPRSTVPLGCATACNLAPAESQSTRSVLCC